MNEIATKLVAGAIAVLALFAAVMYVRELHAELADASHQLDTAKQGIADRDGTIGRLQQDAADKAKQQAQLDRAQGAIASKLSTVQQETRRLINENATLRAWADTPLPDDIVRMQASPALTGAADYSQAMPASDSLHVPGDDATH
ncbi:hypothetical protein R69746_06952 [Paraburkholderia aspalathi]|uniref:Rz-like lysis system protein LysB n=1 Tax=Paraburkholderia aspalathi TaxID=1324617 RepID=UPI00190DD485|nr:Rz-like lysis system protein LysB [Paraburkholderia aspalathi]MBK3842962.1 LysB family phage lysis regulatory protein [Paraburkholderia aspalathi]CAE6841656.1 hypothetical protein R69746_06952 [Paraburkholderia aspalathi]